MFSSLITYNNKAHIHADLLCECPSLCSLMMSLHFVYHFLDIGVYFCGLKHHPHLPFKASSCSLCVLMPFATSVWSASVLTFFMHLAYGRPPHTAVIVGGAYLP